MPGIVGRVGGSPRDDDAPTVLTFLRHFDFYQQKTVAADAGWLSWLGIGTSELHIGRDASSGCIVALHGDGIEGASREEMANTRAMVAERIAANPWSLATELDGTFVAARLDPESGELICQSDPVGQFRLFYLQVGDALYFSPELKGFMGWTELTLEPNPDALRDLINYTYPIGDRTSLRGVRILPPASLLRFSAGELSVEPYWRPRYQSEERNDDELLGQACSLFAENFECRTRRASRLVIPVSGGTDSRLLLAESLDRGRDTRAYTFGHARSREARVAREVMSALGTHPEFITLDDYAAPEDTFRRAAWFAEGMVNLAISDLVAVAQRLEDESRDSLFLNGAFGGPTNFSALFHRPDELVEDMPLDEKVRRIGVTMFSGNLHTRTNYLKLQPDFARDCNDAYLPELQRVFEPYQDVSTCFGHQKDAFFIGNIMFRFLNQLDVNRFYWNETFPLTSTRLYEFYLTLPDRLKFKRLLHRRVIAKRHPQAAAVVHVKTGLSIADELAGAEARTPSPLIRKLRYYIGRLSLGRINLPDLDSYAPHSYLYRRNRKLQVFFEDLLGDTQLLSGDYFDQGVIKQYLRKTRQGSSLAMVLFHVAAWELWLRQLKMRRYDV